MSNDDDREEVITAHARKLVDRISEALIEHMYTDDSQDLLTTIELMNIQITALSTVVIKIIANMDKFGIPAEDSVSTFIFLLIKRFGYSPMVIKNYE